MSRKKSAFRLPLFVSLFFLALAVNLLIESLARLSPFGGIAHLLAKPLPFLANTLLLFSTFSLCLLFRRRIFVLSAVAAGWVSLGIANGVVIFLRRSPLSGIDFAILRSCLPIVKIYLTGWQAALIGLFFLCLAGLAVLLFVKSRKYEVRWEKEVALFLSAVLLTGGVFLFSVKTGAVETGFSDLPAAYEDYGFVTCFSLTVFEHGIGEPEEYGSGTAEALAGRLDELKREEKEAEPLDPAGRPNLVIVQLESFMDPNRLAGAAYSENPAPVFTELKEKYPSGFFRVNTVGAGTANTEFEVLTGIDLGFFGAGEYPYQTVLLEDGAVCESAASDAGAAGYATCAVHNHSASFYDRQTVYGALGFDCFVPLEYMNGVEENPLGWAKDGILTDIAARRLEETAEPDLCFLVSVQPHGLYPDSFEAFAASGDPCPVEVTKLPSGLLEDEERLTIRLTEDGDLFSLDLAGVPKQGTGREDRAETEKARLEARLTYYVNQIRETDAFAGELVSMLEERAARTGEKTLLLLYGDHLPPLTFGENAFSDGSDALDSEYVIVPIGYDGDLSLPDRDLEAWEAGMLLLDLAGIDEGRINLAHRLPEPEDEETAPEDGIPAESGTLPASPLPEGSAKARALCLLAYDLLYGERYAWGGKDPFEREPLGMGLTSLPIRVTGARRIEEDGDPSRHEEETDWPDWEDWENWPDWEEWPDWTDLTEPDLFAVYGENFTPSSVVTVNGRPKKTVFISPEELRAEASPAPFDRIAVIQRTEDYVTVGGTEETAARELTGDEGGVRSD